jgi:hypothetical protein
MNIAVLEPYSDRDEFEEFKWDIKKCFENYLGRKVLIYSDNHGWNNDEVSYEFILDCPYDIFWKIIPNSDWSFSIGTLNGKKDEHLFEAKVSCHDGTSTYKLQIINQEEET